MFEEKGRMSCGSMPLRLLHQKFNERAIRVSFKEFSKEFYKSVDPISFASFLGCSRHKFLINLQPIVKFFLSTIKQISYVKRQFGTKSSYPHH